MTDADRIKEALAALNAFETEPGALKQNRALSRLRAALTKPVVELVAPLTRDCPKCAMTDRMPDQPIECAVCDNTGQVAGITAKTASAFLEKYLWDFIDLAGVFPRCHPDDRTWAHVLAYMPERIPLPESVTSCRAYFGATADTMIATLKRLKVRLSFIGWPAESYWEVRPGVWVQDWRRESHMIDNALHGTPLNEHLWTDPPAVNHNLIPKDSK